MHFALSDSRISNNGEGFPLPENNALLFIVLDWPVEMVLKTSDRWYGRLEYIEHKIFPCISKGHVKGYGRTAPRFGPQRALNHFLLKSCPRTGV